MSTRLGGAVKDKNVPVQSVNEQIKKYKEKPTKLKIEIHHEIILIPKSHLKIQAMFLRRSQNISTGNIQIRNTVLKIVNKVSKGRVTR